MGLYCQTVMQAFANARLAVFRRLISVRNTVVSRLGAAPAVVHFKDWKTRIPINMIKGNYTGIGLPGVILLALMAVSCDSGPGLFDPSASEVKQGATVNTVPADSVVDNTVVPGNSKEKLDGAESSVSLYQKEIELPVCDPGNPEVLFISDDSGWKQINTTSYRVFCIKPGNYASVAGIVLKTSGTETLPRVLMLDGSQSANPSLLPDKEQAIISSLKFEKARHWVVKGLSIINTPKGEAVVEFDTGSSYNLLDSMRIEHFQQGIKIDDGAHGNTIQNSLIGDMLIRKGGDSVCIGLQGFRTRAATVKILDTKILNNEIYDCNDGIQTIINPAIRYTADFSGLVVDGNDIYLTPNSYSNCSGKMDPEGACACAENAIDLKSGAEDKSKPVRVINNRLWGWKKTDTRCGGSGSWGSAISAHFRLKNAEISRNTIFSSSRGISITEGPRAILVTDNLIHGINSTVKNEGIALVATADVVDLKVDGNTIVDSTSWMDFGARESSVECNVIIGSGAGSGVPRDGTVVARNSYYGTTPWRGTAGNDVVYGGAEDSRNVDHCFLSKRISGQQSVCLPFGDASPASPHHACASGN